MTQRLDMVFLYIMEIYEGFKNVIEEVYNFFDATAKLNKYKYTIFFIIEIICYIIAVLYDILLTFKKVSFQRKVRKMSNLSIV